MRKKFSHVTFLHVYHHTGKYISIDFLLLFLQLTNYSQFVVVFLQAWYLVVMWHQDFVQQDTEQWSVCWIVSFTVSCTDIICIVRSMKMLKHRFGGKNTLHKFNSSNFCYWVYIFRLPFLLSIVHTRNCFVSLWRFKTCSWCSCSATSTEKHTYEKRTIDVNHSFQIHLNFKYKIPSCIQTQ